MTAEQLFLGVLVGLVVFVGGGEVLGDFPRQRTIANHLGGVVSLAGLLATLISIGWLVVRLV